jgi:glycosyltransferase involved in cell wall biosynthesis
MAAVRAAQSEPATAGRVHHLLPDGRPLDLYGDADVFVLPSAGESFGMAAAEAAAAGTAVVVSDRCGVAEFLGERGSVVVPYDGAAVREAVARLLGDAALRERIAAGGVAVARELSWAEMVRRQEAIYERALVRV